VVTSPPYPGVYDYVPLQQLRLAWLGLDAGDSMRKEIGSRRSFRADRKEALAQWRADTVRWIRASAKTLVGGGRIAVVIGDGVVGDRPIDSLGALTDAAASSGLSRVARATVERWDEGLDRVRAEHAVLYERHAPAAPASGAELQ
jgi:DNA modification methylase